MDVSVILSTYYIIILRFLFGAFGALVYFVSVKTGFAGIERVERVPKDFENPYLKKWQPIAFFCLVGGVFAVLYETNYLGSFIQGFIVRPTVKSLAVRGGK